MKVVYYGDIERTNEIFALTRKYIAEVLPELDQSYNLAEQRVRSAEINLTVQLRSILGFLSGRLNGEAILDLGCGSTERGLKDGIVFGSGAHEPWLCRALYHMGVNIMGVDKGSLDTEHFMHYQTPLERPDSLDPIEDNSVDIVNASMLFTAQNGVQPYILKRGLMPQLERILKPDGVFLYNDVRKVE